VAQADVLDIHQASPAPQELELFGQLRRDGQLPGGCLGGTCTGTQIKAIVQDAFSKTYFPITATASVAVLCICCSVVCACRRRFTRGALVREVSSQRSSGTAPAAFAVQAQAVANQPTAPDTLDVAMPDFIEPIRQGAAAISEQLSGQPAMADALDAVMQGVVEPIRQGAVSVAEQVAHAAEERWSGQPTMADALDAVMQGVVEPIRQGAAAVAEQVAQAVEPGASSSPSSRAC